MMHSRRRWGITKKTVEQIAQDLIKSDVWVLCNGYLFEHGGQQYVMLNDSTSENSVQEYAILLVERVEGNTYYGKQVESLTTTWARRKDDASDELASVEQFAAEIRKCAECRKFGKSVLRFAANEDSKHRCYLCA